MLLPLFLACHGGESKVVVEPLLLPEDPAASGVPVGVRTVVVEDQTLEIWYPATDASADQDEDQVDFDAFLPAALTELIPELDLPELAEGGVRDADLRPGEAPYPVILFSHGFGGMRVQSMDYASHLASRGYVVVAADHPGRMLGDVLPCLFSPPLEGCDLSSMAGADPALEDLNVARSWVADAADEGFFAGALDTEQVGLSGHSAGAGSTATLGELSESYQALLMMAGGAALSRDVPAMMMGGACDPYATAEGMVEGAASSPDAASVQIQGAGHLAFADLCALDLGGLAQTWLLDRDDINETFVDGLLGLATDGCPGATPQVASCDSFLDLETSSEIIRYYSTVFFDEALRGEGPGVSGQVYAEADVVSAP